MRVLPVRLIFCPSPGIITAVLTILQIDTAAAVPIIRTAALLALESDRVHRNSEFRPWNSCQKSTREVQTGTRTGCLGVVFPSGFSPGTRVPVHAIRLLVCTLMSLLYGCLYTVRFGSMKAMYKASEWALVSSTRPPAPPTTLTSRAGRPENDTNRYWNVWVMLAMPAVWLLWWASTTLLSSVP